MIVFSNGSLTRQTIRDKFANFSWEEFSNILSSIPHGNDGYMGFYYLVPEITPSVPSGVHLFGKDNEKLENFPNPRYNVRAVVESQFLSMKLYSKSIGLKITERIIATGGASKNAALLQLLSDVFGVPVSNFDVPNSAALGAAFRAYHGLKKTSNSSLTFFDSVKVPRTYFQTFYPNMTHHQVYEELLLRFNALQKQIRDSVN